MRRTPGAGPAEDQRPTQGINVVGAPPPAGGPSPEQVLEAADGDFNTLLELGFASSIRREYAWRTDRGESVANLAAFEHLFDRQ